MNDLKIFKNDEFGEVRTTMIGEKPYFVANDVARSLGYAEPKNAIARHCKGALKQSYLTDGGKQEMKVIPEGDVYRLIMKSKLPSAEKFESWVMDEVLPSIRKNGGYIANQENLTDEELLEKAVLVAKRKIEERDRIIEQQKQKIESDKPKTIFADAVEASSHSILIGDLAKLICQNGVKIGQNRLFDWMYKNGYLIESGSRRRMPTQRSMDMKLFEVKERVINNPDGSVMLTRTTKVTGKGQQYFINKFLGSNGGSV